MSKQLLALMLFNDFKSEFSKHQRALDKVHIPKQQHNVKKNVFITEHQYRYK